MINLLPPEVKENTKLAKYNVILLQYVFVIVIAVGIMAYLMTFGRQALTRTRSDIENSLSSDRARVAELKGVNDEATDLSNTINTIDTLLDREVKFSLLLQEIGSIMPPGAKLSALALSQDATQPVRLSVDLTSAERAGVLQQNLAESEIFIGADIISVNQGSPDSKYPFAGDLQAYYDPSFSLNALGDKPVQEVTESAEEEPAQTSNDDTTPADDTSQPEEDQEESIQ